MAQTWAEARRRLLEAGISEEDIERKAKPRFFQKTMSDMGVTDPDEIESYKTKFFGGEETDILDAIKHGGQQILPKMKQHFADQAASTYRMLPMPEASSEKPLEFIERLRDSAQQGMEQSDREFIPDTFAEKVASGVASFPGDVVPMAPYMVAAGPLGPFAGPAVGLGSFGAVESVGRGEPLSEAAKHFAAGGAEGLAFGAAGKLAGALGAATNPALKRLYHAMGASGVSGSAAALRGEDAEDVAAAAATMFSIAGLMPGGRRKRANDAPRTELERAKNEIEFSAPDLTSRIPDKQEFIMRLREGWTDEGARVDHALVEAIKRQKLELEPFEDPVMWRKGLYGASSVQAREGAHLGFQDFLDPAITTKGITQILKESRPSERNEIGRYNRKSGMFEWEEDFQAYIAAKSVAEDIAAGKKFKGLTDKPLEVIADVQQKYSPEAVAKLETASASWNEMGNFFVDMLQRAGRYTPEAAESIKSSRSSWVGLNRALENEAGNSGPIKSGGKAIQKRTGGSGQKINDVIVNAMVLAERSYKEANHNYYMNRVVDVLGPESGIIEPVKSIRFERGIPKKVKLKTESKTLDSIDKATKIKEVTKIPVGEVKKQSIAKMRQRFDDADNVITFYRDGKPVSYKFEEPYYKAIKRGGPPGEIARWAEILFKGPKRMAVLGMTGLNPGFSYLTNTIRDTPTAMLQSQEPGFLGVGHLKRMYDTTIGELTEGAEAKAAPLGGISGARKRFLRSGGTIGGPVEGDIRVGLSARDRVLANADKLGFRRSLIRHPIDTTRILFGKTENLNRFPEYLAMEQKYGAGTPNSMVAGRYASREVSLDFLRYGKYSKWANEYVPFFSPTIGGAAKFARTLKERPAAALVQAGVTMTGPALALWAINRDEDWYQEIPNWEKQLFAHLKPFEDGPIFRLALPFEWGMAFFALPVAAADSAWKKTPDSLKKWFDEALKVALPDIMPQFAKPVIEIGMNKDLFRESKIESAGMQRRIPPERYRESTPLVYRGAGELLGASPMKLQHLAEGYTGGLIREPVNFIETLAGRTKKGHGLPLLNRLVSNQDRQGQSVSDFYNQKQEMEQIWNSAKKRRESGDYVGARALLKNNAGLLGISDSQADMLLRTTKWTLPEKMKRFNKIEGQMSKVRRRKGENSELTALARLALGRN